MTLVAYTSLVYAAIGCLYAVLIFRESGGFKRAGRRWPLALLMLTVVGLAWPVLAFDDLAHWWVRALER